MCVYLFFIPEFLIMMLTAFMPFFPLSSSNCTKSPSYRFCGALLAWKKYFSVELMSFMNPKPFVVL